MKFFYEFDTLQKYFEPIVTALLPHAAHCTAGMEEENPISTRGGRVCPHISAPPPLIFRPSAIHVLHFCSFTYKFPKILNFLNQASIAHLIRRRLLTQ